MRALADFIMRSRLQAVGAAAAGAMGSFVIPPLSYLSGAAVALVALRKGPREGALVLAGAAALTAAVTGFAMGAPERGLAFAGVLWLPVLMLALVLRATVSLAFTLEVGGALAVLAVAAVYLTLGDPSPWWRETLGMLFEQLMAGQGPPPLEGEGLAAVARIMTGVAAAAGFMSLALCLLLARWWQAMLYNPGGFRQEFHGLRLSRRFALAALGLFLAASLLGGGGGAFATDAALVMVVVYLFQGLAAVHGTAAKLGLANGWLVVLYVLLVLAPPQTMVALSALGYADTWVDFRNRMRGKAGSE